MMIMGPGSWAGLAIGVVICAIMAVIIYKVSKKEKANTDAILAELPEEFKNEVVNQTYAKTDKANIYRSNGLAISVTEEGDKAKVTLLFYAPEHDEFFTRSVKLSKSEVAQKGIESRKFVPVLMKYDKEMHFYNFKQIV